MSVATKEGRAVLVVCLACLTGALGMAGSACRGSADVESASGSDAATLVPAETPVTVTGTVPQSTLNALSIVQLTPHRPVDVPVPSAPKTMDQFGRTFIPELLITRVGQPVEFHNSEIDLHNVRVIETSTGTTVMNVGMLMGVVYSQTFDRPGIYSVQCDIHPEMFADIVVTDTPYAGITDRQGRFSIPDVPTGVYTLTVRYGAKQLERVVTVDGAGAPLIIEDAS